MMAAEDIADQFEDLKLHFQLAETKLFRGDNCVGTGLLTVDEHEVKWTGENGESVCLTYPEICLHAVSHDTSSFPHPCLYMLTSCVSLGDEEEESGAGDDEEETIEMRLVLNNEGKLQELFEVISEGQALHPDPEDVSDEESEGEEEGAVVLEDIQPLDEGAEFFRTEEDLQFLSPEGLRTLEHIESVIVTSTEAQNGHEAGQFEDACDD